jgi:Skp family chaperone for outer membrane proteins
MAHLIFSTVVALSLLVSSQAVAQNAGSHAPANAAGILNALPPDLYKKLEQLSQLLDQNIKAGKLTDAQVQQDLASGRLEQTIRSLGPEANQLFDEISADMKNGKGPAGEALMPLLGGLGGTRK